MTEVSDWFPNGLRLSDDVLNEVEREGGVRLEPGHRDWLRGVLPLDAHHLPYTIADTFPWVTRSKNPQTIATWRRLKRERTDRAGRLKRIAKFAKLLSAEIDAEVADESRVAPSLQSNLWRVDEKADQLVYADMVRKIATAAHLQHVPRAKEKGDWSRYAPYKNLVLQFAQIYADAGGTPSIAFSDSRGDRCGPFWRALDVIIRQLPTDLRVDVKNLAEHAKRQKWFKKAPSGGNT